MYSERVRKLIAELPNRGGLENPTHSGTAENPICGDLVRIHLVLVEGHVEVVRFQASGCPATIASAAAITEMVEGQDLAFCQALVLNDLLDNLGSLPSARRHGAEVALQALRSAVDG